MGHQEFKFCPKCKAILIEQHIEGRLRQGCTSCGFVFYRDPKPVAGVLAFQGEKLLLIRRGNSPRHGFWSFPTGYIDIGDTPEEAAVREVQEEANVEVALERLLGVYPNTDRTVVLIMYVGNIVAGVPRAGAEALDACLFAKEEFPPFAFKHDYDIVCDYYSLTPAEPKLTRAQRLAARLKQRQTAETDGNQKKSIEEKP